MEWSIGSLVLGFVFGRSWVLAGSWKPPVCLVFCHPGFHLIISLELDGIGQDSLRGLAVLTRLRLGEGLVQFADRFVL